MLPTETSTLTPEQSALAKAYLSSKRAGKRALLFGKQKVLSSVRRVRSITWTDVTLWGLGAFAVAFAAFSIWISLQFYIFLAVNYPTVFTVLLALFILELGIVAGFVIYGWLEERADFSSVLTDSDLSPAIA